MNCFQQRKGWFGMNSRLLGDSLLRAYVTKDFSRSRLLLGKGGEGGNLTGCSSQEFGCSLTFISSYQFLECS